MRQELEEIATHGRAIGRLEGQIKKRQAVMRKLERSLVADHGVASVARALGVTSKTLYNRGVVPKHHARSAHGIPIEKPSVLDALPDTRPTQAWGLPTMDQLIAAGVLPGKAYAMAQGRVETPAEIMEKIG